MLIAESSKLLDWEKEGGGSEEGGTNLMLI